MTITPENVSTEAVALCLITQLRKEGRWNPTPNGEENNGVMIVYDPSRGAVGDVVEPSTLRWFVKKCIQPQCIADSMKQLDEILRSTRSNNAVIPFVLYRVERNEGAIGAWDINNQPEPKQWS